jgi:hypothetical protein
MITYKSISKELRLLIAEKQADCKSEKEMNKAINDAREDINKKYGKDWRDLKEHHDIPKFR